jgi:hypothetical protein
MTRLLTLCAAAVEILAAEAGADAAPALPRFRMTAYTGGPMRLAGWRHPVVVDLAGLAVDQVLPIRLNHDVGLGVGHTDAVRVEGGQLVAEGVISRATSSAQDVVASGRAGFPWQASIGASVGQHEFLAEGKDAVVNGRTVTGPITIVRASSLGEISFVDRGADSRTSAAIAASAAQDDTMTHAERLAALIAAHGEQHRPAILEHLVAGAEDAEISAAIEAAAVAAQRRADEAARELLTAERDDLAAQVAALTAKAAGLEAQLAAAAQQPPAPAVAAGAGLTLDAWAALPPAERARRRHELAK